jgi:hypothetical protein
MEDSHNPCVAAFAEAVFPLKVMVTLAFGFAWPHTAASLSRCNTM